MSPPVIREVKKSVPIAELVIIDAPPGTSCPVIETVRDADYLLLVTEPTPFGLNDLKLAVEMAKALILPFGVAINRADSGDDETRKFCKENDIEIVSEIPGSRKVAEAYSRGETAFKAIPEFREIFTGILEKITGKGRAAK
jgi:MinD superfamily P-loop ATPase